MKRIAIILICGVVAVVAAVSLYAQQKIEEKTTETGVAMTGEADALTRWQAGEVVSENAVKLFGLDRCFKAEPISDAVFARMKGKSYPAGCTVARTDLRYVKALHYDAEGKLRIGEMVCNKAIANDLVEIFRELFRQHYPIERMVLIDNYDADDERSMRDNNSSCFCYRRVAGSKTLSKHATGMAVDINTLYNPYARKRSDGSWFIQPATAKPYCDRTKQFPYKIVSGDLCCRLFKQHGFRWGGDWKAYKDYQHFDK